MSSRLQREMLVCLFYEQEECVIVWKNDEAKISCERVRVRVRLLEAGGQFGIADCCLYVEY